ncbi:hypothetical protein LOTGIDRAFT_155867 [Lottia gigantea]|uniref:Apple domain-containing protein n=1 Tax=Lottia gigantea TaxID=225164 RepID=V3ZFI8_LOTGI|nr:hypothetical protein LOTGIDRAFT_155867 [Lottia gigantea]ESO82832.1 hypothetical protein LOTGIDRAFT_155867 [Lottia gigantea]
MIMSPWNCLGIQLAFLFSDFKMLQCATSPKLKWPLCHLSFSYETINANDGIFPKLSDCFEVEDSDSTLFTNAATWKGLFYNGSTFSQVNIPSGNLKNTQFAFSIFINPLVLNGCVLQYIAGTTSNSDVTEIDLCFVSDDLKCIIKSSNGNNLGEVNGGSLTVDSWSLVQFGFHGGDTLVIRVNGGSVTPVSISSVNFRDYGTLTVGNSYDGSQGFIGTLTCLMAFDDALLFQTRLESEEECEDTGNWGKKPYDDFTPPKCILQPSYPGAATTTTATTTTAATTTTTETTTTSVSSTQAFSTASLLYAWPLDNKSYGYETFRNIPPSVSDLSSCPRIECNNTVFPFPAMLFDGAAGSHIKTLINQTIFVKSFTIGFFFYPEFAPSGTVLHIIDQVTVSGLNELRIDVNMCNLTITVKKSASAVCAMLTSNMTKISEWNILIVTRNENTQMISIILNNESITIHDNCSSSHSPRSSEIYIGRTSASFTSFRGYMRCLAIFDDVVNPDLQQICNSAPITSFNALDIECEVTTMNWIYFRKVNALMRPDVGKAEIKRMEAMQLKSCAVNCLNSRFCRSFVFDIAQKLCFLYDFVTRNGLVENNSGNYYIVINKLQQL